MKTFDIELPHAVNGSFGMTVGRDFVVELLDTVGSGMTVRGVFMCRTSCMKQIDGFELEHLKNFVSITHLQFIHFWI